MQEQYRPEEIESSVQLQWQDKKTFKVIEDASKQKYYCLSMLPYPSGHLHMGHVRNYVTGDVISRYQRMLGKNVLQPIGWDAFGLPAEAAAIKNRTEPAMWTYNNIKYMKNQLKLLGLSYDWDREITTCEPSYYRWEQWFFTKLYQKGLVYKNTSKVNWCPQDLTVLANEQVINGACWRCDTRVEQKEIPQWFIKITDYAEQLLNDLDSLENWPEQVKTMQRNWIGRSTGVDITFKIIDNNEQLIIYTARPDIFMGVTYIVLSINHPLVQQSKDNNPALAKFVEINRNVQFITPNMTMMEKKGMSTGLFAIHPLNGEKLPIWVSNFTFIKYNTSAVMAVPAHDQNDWEFATRYNLPIKPIILDREGCQPNVHKKAMTKKGRLFNSGEFNGLDNLTCFNLIINKLVIKGIGQRKVHYRLRDWGISRQRYWGAPIPMMMLEDGSLIPTPEDQLPVILPKDVVINGILNPLKAHPNWAKTHVNGQQAYRETDTFDTFMESSWYYARYTCSQYNKGMLDLTAANYWLPVDQYIGGIEHATMHLMYFRFFHKLMRDAGLVNSDEPAKRLLCQGMVVADSFYYISNSGARIWVSPSNVAIERDDKSHIIKATDLEGHELVHVGMSKMSKSKNNGINPEEIIKKYGADTMRLFIMFAAPIEMTLQWKESGIEGANRFLKRLWKLTYDHLKKGKVQPLKLTQLTEEQKILRRDVHRTIAKVSDDIGRRQTFNTAIAAVMELMNTLIRAPQDNEQERAVLQEALLAVVCMLSPFTPHISFALWEALGGQGGIDTAPWPVVDEQAITQATKLVVVQINGKLRAKITVAADASEEQVRLCAAREHLVAKYLNGVILRKVIYIPGKLLNLVVV
ncbi:leucine--tRNA ligase [Candidatus Gillettellia adelgis]